MKKFFNKLESKIQAKTPKAGDIRYAGFNIRVYASLIDMFVLMLILAPFAFLFSPKPNPNNMPIEVRQAMYMRQAGEISFEEMSRKIYPYVKQQAEEQLPVAVTLVTLLFSMIMIFSWKYSNTTPGKKLFGLKIVDAKSFEVPSLRQYIMRLIGYIIASIPFGFGFFICALNPKKRGLHDFMAGTSVIFAEAFDPVKEKKKLKYQAILLLVTVLLIAIYYSTKN